jgi:uncharacterized protein YciI
VAVYAAIYTYSESKHEQRVALLDEHRSWLGRLRDDARLHEAGPTAGQPGALLVFEFGSLSEATAALDEDPFFAAGLIENRIVSEWQVRWGVVAASSAAHTLNVEVNS